MEWGSSTRRGGGRTVRCPLSKVCVPWVSKRGIWDVPGILPGCPGPLGVFKKFVQKDVRAHFSFPKLVNLRRNIPERVCKTSGFRHSAPLIKVCMGCQGTTTMFGNRKSEFQ